MPFWTIVSGNMYFNTVFCSVVRGRSADQAERAQELDRALIQQLRERCEQQSLQLQILQAQFKKASMCLDVFSITTQHFCQKVGSRKKTGGRRQMPNLCALINYGIREKKYKESPGFKSWLINERISCFLAKIWLVNVSG